MELIEKIKKYPVVNSNLLMKHFSYSKEYSYLVLQRLSKRGILKKIIKGKYTAQEDIYKIASHLYFPGYISLLTASMLKGCTEQIVNTVQVISTFSREIGFQGYTIEFIKSDYVFGFRKEQEIFISDNEKLLIDMLVHRTYSGNFEEIIKAASTLEFNKARAIEYLKRIDCQSLTKRTGFVLEKYSGIDISSEFRFDTNYVVIDILSRGSSKTDSKWRINYD